MIQLTERVYAFQYYGISNDTLAIGNTSCILVVGVAVIPVTCITSALAKAISKPKC